MGWSLGMMMTSGIGGTVVVMKMAAMVRVVMVRVGDGGGGGGDDDVDNVYHGPRVICKWMYAKCYASWHSSSVL